MDSVISDKALWVPAIAWCVSQVLKVIIYSLKNRRFSFSYFSAMGGMPSSHATLVCALATTVAIVYGVNSAVFAIAAFFALVVMYDAAGVRQTVSEQSAVLNRMLDELFEGKPAFEQRLRELVGHTRLEVIAGAALGVLLAFLLT